MKFIVRIKFQINCLQHFANFASWENTNNAHLTSWQNTKKTTTNIVVWMENLTS